MGTSASQKLVRFFLCIPLMAMLIFQATAGQTTSAPAVNVSRNPALWGAIWPGDFNGDGKTDLLATDSSLAGNPAVLMVALGNGAGSFGAPLKSTVRGGALAVGHFNGDSRLDAIAADESGSLFVLPGNGNGTFATARKIADDSQITFAVAADLDGDGKRDLIVSSEGPGGLRIHPGNGDFTFAPPIPLTPGPFPHDAIVADLNGDGRNDFVVANHYQFSVSVFMNQGSMVFNATDIAVGGNANDVTAADLNGDGKRDLIVATSSGGDGDNYFGVGHAEVLIGRGDGTFAPFVQYQVMRGAWQVVVGDFNRDGITDIGTANKSAQFFDDCGPSFRTWDSLSILPGRSGGTFDQAFSFSLGDQSNPNGDTRFKSSVRSLNTSDLNGDGAIDLIASQGVVLMNAAPRANRPATANAGPDQVLLNTTETILRGAGGDPDSDVLTFHWVNQAGAPVGDVPNPCLSGLSEGSHAFTLTVDDGHGHQASDSVIVTVTSSSSGHGAFAAGSDIGAVAAAGSDSFDGTRYTVTGSGADIWGTADEFHYVWTQASGDFQITTLVESVQNINVWTKAGLMIRENLNAGARHASLFATPGKGFAFQARRVENGISVHRDWPVTHAAPIWLMLTRRGDFITAFYRQRVTAAWNVIDEYTLTGLPPTVHVGLAVTSHQDGTKATATFSNLRLDPAPRWVSTTIGAGTGFASTDNATFGMSNRGADIWGTADAFQYLHTTFEGSGTLTARLISIDNTHAWAKAGVMFRDSLNANAKHVMVVVTPGKGVVMQWRAATGGVSTTTASLPGTAPKWIRLTRNGNTFTGFVSSDFVTWTQVGAATVVMSADPFTGLALTSHNTATIGTASFDDVFFSN
jgi:VCBS repeat protein/K319-like protein